MKSLLTSCLIALCLVFGNAYEASADQNQGKSMQQKSEKGKRHKSKRKMKRKAEKFTEAKWAECCETVENVGKATKKCNRRFRLKGKKARVCEAPKVAADIDESGMEDI